MPPKERKRVAGYESREDEEKGFEFDCLPSKIPKLLDEEKNKDELLGSGDDEAAKCETVSKIEERVEEVLDEEESGVVVVEMKWKTPMEKERSRQGRKRQLQEYHKREAVLARQERYRKRCRGVEACDSGAVNSAAPLHPPVSRDTTPKKRVKWKRDDSLVEVHEMPVEDASNVRSDLCEKPSKSGSGSTPNHHTVYLSE